jgi:predicted nucleotidyltransferase
MSPTANSIDITPEQKAILQGLLCKHLPDTEVWAYGSRVKGTAKSTSDLDLVSIASRNQKMAVSDLREAFDESNLPFRVDFFIWDELPESFHRHIKEAYVILQPGKGAQSPAN